MDKMEVLEILEHSNLCKNITIEDRELLLANSKVKRYAKGNVIFYEGDKPSCLYMLLQGNVGVMKHTLSGKRIMITNIEQPGELFGEVYLFMGKEAFEVQAEAVEASIVLEITLHIFQGDQKKDELEKMLSYNMMEIFAKKAYFLSSKVRVLGSANLRSKIAMFLLERQNKDGSLRGNFAREDMADYLCVARPSLSRELSNMAKEGILEIEGRKIRILEQAELESYL